MTDMTSRNADPPASLPVAPAGARGSPDLRALTVTLWRGKRAIALSALLGLIAGGYYAFVAATPVFRATSVLMLETRRESVVDLQSVIGGLTGDATEINSEAEVLRSRDLLGRVVDRLRLDRDPEFAAPAAAPQGGPGGILSGFRFSSPAPKPDPPRTEGRLAPRDMAVSALLDRISVRNVPLSLVFKVTAESGDPAKAARIADAVARQYIQDQIDAKHAATEQAKRWLQRQADGLGAELERAEAAVADFSASTDLISAEALQALERRLKELRERIGKAELAAQEAREKHEALLAAETGQDRAYLAGDPELNRLLIRAGPDNAKSAAFETRFSQILARASAEVSRAEQQLAALRRSEALLGAQLDRQGADLIRLQQLTREAAATRELYEYFLGRLKETAAQQGFQRPDSRILSAAVVPRKPARPRRPLVLSLSLLMGLTAGLGLVLLRATGQGGFRNAGDVEILTGLPVLAQLAPPPRRRLKARNNETNSLASPMELNLALSLTDRETDRPPKVILSAPVAPGGNPVETSVALARGLVGLGHSVLLIDLDFEPGDGSLTGPATGLAQVLAGTAVHTRAIRRWTAAGVDVLPAGRSQGDRGTVSLGRFRRVLADLRDSYDAIVVTAPADPVAPQTGIVARLADMVVLTLCLDSTRSSDVQDALRSLGRSDRQATAAVLAAPPRRTAGRARRGSALLCDALAPAETAATA